MSVLNRDCSVFRNVRATRPQRQESVLNLVTTIESEILDVIEKVRKAGSKEERDKLKEKVPAYTPSVLLEGGRKKSNIIERTGIICLDIDHGF